MHRVHDWLRDSAARDGEKIAYVDARNATSYGELERAASSLAATLRRLGVERGDRVAIAIDRHIDYLIAFYGALKGGACPVPLCDDTRIEPLCEALAHSGAKVLVIGGADARYLCGQAQRVPELRHLVHCGPVTAGDLGGIETIAIEEAIAGPEMLHDERVGDDDLAALMYTSGTTGKSRGVMLSHANLRANTRSISDYLALDASDVAGMLLPYYYAYGNSVLHTHIRAGATIAHLGTLAFPAVVLEAMQRHGVTGLAGVPTTFARLTALEKIGDYNLSHLRYLTQAGAAMTPALTQRLHTTFPTAEIYVMYGQTEACARLAYVPWRDLERKMGSAGKAIPGVELRIMDGEGRELPRGQVGEIIARGDNVMRGYWNDPGETNRVLRPEGLRTGDLAYMDEEGFVFIQGRTSEMIKSGGHRISPYRIEDVIAAVPGVFECAVVGVPDEFLGQKIVAFIAPHPGIELTRKELLDACHTHLPRHMMPAEIRFVSALPRSPAGKIRRGHLLRAPGPGIPRGP